MKRIIAVGDSLTHGYMNTAGESITEQTYPYLLMQRLGETNPTFDYTDIFASSWDDNDSNSNDANTLIGTNYTMLNSGVNGDDTNRILSRWVSDVINRAPDVVIFMAGTNDLGIMGGTGEYSAINVANRILQMIDSVIAIDAIPILLTCPAWGTASLPWVTQLNNLLMEGAATRNSVLVLDAFSILCETNGVKRAGYAQADGIHLTLAGNTALANGFNLSWFPPVSPQPPIKRPARMRFRKNGQWFDYSRR